MPVIAPRTTATNLSEVWRGSCVSLPLLHSHHLAWACDATPPNLRPHGASQFHENTLRFPLCHLCAALKVAMLDVVGNVSEGWGDALASHCLQTGKVGGVLWWRWVGLQVGCIIKWETNTMCHNMPTQSRKGGLLGRVWGAQASPATAASSTECAKSGHVEALLKGPWSILMLLMGKPNPWQTYTVIHTRVQGTTSGLGWSTCKVDGGRAHHGNSVACCDVPRHIVGNHRQRLCHVNVSVRAHYHLSKQNKHIYRLGVLLTCLWQVAIVTQPGASALQNSYTVGEAQVGRQVVGPCWPRLSCVVVRPPKPSSTTLDIIGGRANAVAHHKHSACSVNDQARGHSQHCHHRYYESGTSCVVFAHSCHCWLLLLALKTKSVLL